jgi:hypothetical protein
MENSIYENWIVTTPWNIYIKLLKKPSPGIKFKYTSTKEIKIMITFLKPNSHGYDVISTKILKASSQFINSPLTYICNQSKSTVVFPSCLKYSIVKPLFKNGNKKDMSNYRPISY